jgi:hypothetical protein
VLTFCGSDIELVVDTVLVRGDWPELCCARDFTGVHWLVVQVDDDPVHLAWLCAPISERALHAVTSGRATPRDAVSHSATGIVELVTIDNGRAVPDQSLLCASIPEHLLPRAERVPAAAAA